MINEELLNALRYKSEGTDLDFKSEQYRFIGANDHEKSEMLKDILALANAWRDGAAYILIGFKDCRPHLAEIVGISESFDDSRLQQFVNSKVKPKLIFRYEEHIYEDKTVGVIVIPKQKRPFFIEKAYGKLSKNVVYVRRGSSTEEAEPTEIVAMGLADSGHGQMRVDLSVLTPENELLLNTIDHKYMSFSKELPDYESVESHERFGVSMLSLEWRDNKDFWREYAEHLRVKSASIKIKFVLNNSSDIQLSNAKLEVGVEALDGQSFQMLVGEDLPEYPQSQYQLHSIISGPYGLPRRVDQQERLLVIDDSGGPAICNVHFGSLLPGEKRYSSDTLVVVPFAPGGLKMHFRILAGELSTPEESEFLIQTTGERVFLDIEKLREMYVEDLMAKFKDESL